jgi:hemolysin activation/secretion protein
MKMFESMVSVLRRIWIILAGSTVCMLCAGSAVAQTASQVTPQTFEPQTQRSRVGGGVVIPDGAGPIAPDGAETLEVEISGVDVEGGLAELAAETAKIVAELSGKTVSAAKLFEAAGDLQAAYAEKGYGLMRVVLPAQRLTNGAVLRLVVIDGFIEEIDTSNLPENIRDRVTHMLAPIAGRRAITNSEIERRLLLAGDTPGTVMRSTLSKGNKPGGSILTIEARYKPVTGSLSVDNSLSDALGNYNLALGTEFNSLLGFGELFYLRADGAPSFDSDGDFFSNAPRNRALSGGVIVPLGIDGLTFNLEGTLARTAPEATANGPAFLSDLTRTSARLVYPVIRSRDFMLNVKGVFDVQDETLSLRNGGGITISQDRLRVLRAGADFSWYAPGDALIFGSLTGSFGIDGLGARNQSDAAASGTTLSRQGADADFHKLDIMLGYRQPVAEHLVLDFKARAQTSFGEPLLNAEQIGLASSGGLSSFPLGSVQGDSGFALRWEAQFPFATAVTLPFTVPDFPKQQGTGLPQGSETSGALYISPYVFGAYGGVKLYEPTVLERGFSRGAAYGVGLRLGVAGQSSFNSVTLNLEYGRAERFGNGANDNRFTLSTAFQF